MNIYCIRHGYSKHNQLYKLYGEEGFIMDESYNSRLIQSGINQAYQLKNTIDSLLNLNNIDAVLVSPLTRTLETANIIFSDKNIPIIANEYLMEYPSGLHKCNKRNTKTNLINEFPNIDFSHLTSEMDLLWKPKIFESLETLYDRIDKLKLWLKNKNYNTIVIVGHTSHLSHFIYHKYMDLKHCQLYHYILE